MTERQLELMEAVRIGNLAQVRELLDAWVDPNCRYNVTPLQVAVKLGNVDMVEQLLDACARPNARSLMGHTPLELAMVSDLPEEVMLQIVRLLLEEGADPLRPASGGGSHYSLARKRNSPALLELMKDYEDSGWHN